MKTVRLVTVALVLVSFCIAGQSLAQDAPEDAGQRLLQRYTGMLNKLRGELSAKIPKSPSEEQASKIIASSRLDDKLVKYVVLKEGTPQGLAGFAKQGKKQEALIEQLLSDPTLMKQMLIADGARAPKGGSAQYGRAMEIYSEIQKKSRKASSGILQRLAVATALQHSVPHAQRSAVALTDAPKTVDPVKRYFSYEKAYLAGELDKAFPTLDAFNLRFVVHGEEPDEISAWGREMLKNYRPDFVLDPNYGWKYVRVVPSEVRYGSGDCKYDRPELQFFQNIIMNGGVCGRRAFFGRFICRSFGIPTTARPSRGHAALAHWTPKGWVVNLGGGWGAGWTKTIYNRDKDFLATTQARLNSKEYPKVKRAMWIGDLMGEKRVYGEQGGKPGFWGDVSLKTQRKIITESKAETLAALGAHLGESNRTVADKIMAVPASPEDKKIVYASSGGILIPAAAYTKADRDVKAMKSFSGGMQIFCSRFSRQGITLMRGGAWRGGADSCRSGWRMPSSGYGRYNNWGFRAAMSPAPGKPRRDVTLDLGDGVKMEMIYIKPGKFIMGGTNTKDQKWHAVETPKHDVELTKGYYLGKYEVTQEQFQKMTGRNPSGSKKHPKHPADTVAEGDALDFCAKVSVKTGQNVRLPTEAEWEYACRAGTKTKFFFGDTPSRLDDYAWYDKNDGGSSHPVGQKKPNPWGLYDILGNVCERVSDVYNKDYYKKSPRKDPTGPMQGEKSHIEYQVTVPRAGKYALAAKICNVNYDQRMNVSANGSPTVVMTMPYTCGEWKNCRPVTVSLKQGENILRLWRDNPPQYGLALKALALKPM